jgi:cytoskeletal protein RodZ
MAFWDRFRKNNNQSMLPDEVNKYYQSEQTGNRGKALLLGVGTLIVTVLLAGALFMGGRAVYRQFSKDDTATTTNNDNNQGQNGSSNTPSTDQPSSQNNGSGGTSTPGSSDTTPPPSTTTPGGGAVPRTGDESATTPSGLPHTGDPGM